MSIYKGGNLVMGGVSAVNEEKMKEIAKEVYSTDEIVIGTWINGKPLYRKVITGGTDGSLQTIYTLSDKNINLINFYGTAKSVAESWTVPINFYDSLTIADSYVSQYGLMLSLISSGSNVQNTYEIVLEYTKTTD